MIHYWEMAERVAQPTCVPCQRGKTPVVMVRCTRVKNECPYMKQFINEDNDGNIETNHSDGRA